MEAMKTVKECKKKGYQGISVILNGAIAIFINGFIVQAGILGWIFAIVGIVIELIAIVVDPEKADSFADVMDKAIFYFFGTLAWWIISLLVIGLLTWIF